MNEIEIDLDDIFESPREFFTPISQSPTETPRHDSDTEVRIANGDNDTDRSTIDIGSISIALDNDASPSVSIRTDDHRTNRNILSVQKEEAFEDWLTAKKFVYISDAFLFCARDIYVICFFPFDI